MTAGGLLTRWPSESDYGLVNNLDSGASQPHKTSEQHGGIHVMAELPPSTSSQIADAVGLNERYVREWLGGMTTGGVVEYNPGFATYFLPRDRAALLTRPAGPDNLARTAQFIPMLGEVEQKVVGCFREGGGLSYSDYPRFHAVMAEESGEVFDAALVDVILPLADGLPGRLREGAEVADFGCGSGRGRGRTTGTDQRDLPAPGCGRRLALSMLSDAGFTDVRVEEIETDPINYYYIARK